MIILLYWLGALGAFILAFIWGAEIKHAQYASDIEELTAQRNAAQEVLAFVKEENLKIRQLLGTPDEADAVLYGAQETVGRDSAFAEQAFAEMRRSEC